MYGTIYKCNESCEIFGLYLDEETIWIFFGTTFFVSIGLQIGQDLNISIPEQVIRK